MKNAHWQTKVLFFILALGVGANHTLASEKMTSLPSLKKLLRKVATEKANCEKDKCDRLKDLTEFEQTIKMAIEYRTANGILGEEIKTLKEQILAQENAAELTLDTNLAPGKSSKCFKTELRTQKLIDLGIDENGSLIYSKAPLGEGQAQCWSNGRKKKEATVTFCELPYKLNISTVGSEGKKRVKRDIEYVFALNDCDLKLVKLTDEDNRGHETSKVLSREICLKHWNKRTADAAMTKDEVALMEKTIQQCFQFNLLPVAAEREPKARKPVQGQPSPSPKSQGAPGASPVSSPKSGTGT